MAADSVSIDADEIEAFKTAGVLSVFLALPPSHQREWHKWISEAKKPATRANRITKTVEELKKRSKA